MALKLIYLPNGTLDPHSVQAIAEHYGLNQEAFAKLIGFTGSGVSGWKKTFKDDNTKGVSKKYIGTILGVFEECRQKRKEQFPDEIPLPPFQPEAEEVVEYDVFGTPIRKKVGYSAYASPSPAAAPKPEHIEPDEPEGPTEPVTEVGSSESEEQPITGDFPKSHDRHPVISGAAESLEDVQELLDAGKHRSANRLLHTIVTDLQGLL